MFTKQPTMDMDIEFDIKLLATEYYEGTVGIIYTYNTIQYAHILYIATSLCILTSRTIFAPEIRHATNFLPAQTK